MMNENNYNHPLRLLKWKGNLSKVTFQEEQIFRVLLKLDQPIYVLDDHDRLGYTVEGSLSKADNLILEEGERQLAAYLPPLTLQQLGDETFCSTYGCRYAYYGGAMANAISSEEMVIALGKAGLMGSFGAAGLSLPRIEKAIHTIKAALPNGPYLFNLINSPNEPAVEQNTVELYLKHEIRAIEASAYLGITLPLVQYRVSGLIVDEQGMPQPRNRIIAKVSRKEVAKHFLLPPATDLVQQLLAAGKITAQQAALAEAVPMADDITVEADSGGHTDNRPLVLALPAIIALRDEIQAEKKYPRMVRIGAGGGIGTPAAAYAALQLGAAYLVSGSVNQSCVESGTSDHVKKSLSQMEMTDVAMAPAADMFEMGVKVQVLKRGTMFAMRALKLYELYVRYGSLEEIPAEEREKIEKQIFKRTLEDVWEETQRFFSQRDASQIERARRDPKQKMALVFRWYLGLSSQWAVLGEKGREVDYQIWCGPSLGAFNDWVRGSYLAEPEQRHVADVALHLLSGAAYLRRLHTLADYGIPVAASWFNAYRPFSPLV